MTMPENSFLEYLQLQGGSAELVTKSELIARVREAGFGLTDRQLTFYATEALVPKSVRVGSRAGAYPAIVVELLTWILQARGGGVGIEALRELLPVWKHLIQARNDGRLNLAELEYIARQHVTSVEGSFVVAHLVTHVMAQRQCATCGTSSNPACEKVVLVHKNGTELPLWERDSTIGFAIARPVEAESPADDSSPAGDSKTRWYATTRIALATTTEPATDPTVVILGIKPNDPLPVGSDPQLPFTSSTPSPARDTAAQAVPAHAQPKEA
jgi:hypothetical protein